MEFGYMILGLLMMFVGGGWVFIPLVICLVVFGKGIMKWKEHNPARKVVTVIFGALFVGTMVWAVWPTTYPDDMGGTCTQHGIFGSTCTNPNGGM